MNSASSFDTLIGSRGVPVCDLGAVAGRLGQSVAAVERSFATLIEAGLLIACYAELGDVAGLDGAWLALEASLARLDAEGGMRTPTAPSNATRARFEAIRRSLVSPAATVGD